MSSRDFVAESYNRHFKEWNDRAPGEANSEVKPWFESDEVGRWRYERIYKFLNPLIETFPKSKWFTIGDGFYGGDAYYLQNKGIDVVATNLSAILLRESENRGVIKKFSEENAEKLSFQDSSFDFCLCKESYHHFPRPMLALYESLRVAKMGVVYIEPIDYSINSPFLEKIFFRLSRVAKTLLRKKIISVDYEDVGNYVFTLSSREIEKVALGLNFPTIAFNSVNDFYLENSKNLSMKQISKITKRRIRLLDWFAKLGMRRKALLVSIILKNKPTEALRNALLEMGYEIKDLPRNPHIKLEE